MKGGVASADRQPGAGPQDGAPEGWGAPSRRVALSSVLDLQAVWLPERVDQVVTFRRPPPEERQGNGELAAPPELVVENASPQPDPPEHPELSSWSNRNRGPRWNRFGAP